MKSARSTCMRGNEANTPREPLIHNMGVLDDGTLSSRRWARLVSTSDLSRLLRTTQRRVGELAVAALIVAAPPVFTSLN